MNVPITIAVIAGILSVVPGSPALAGTIAKTSAPKLVSTVNSRDVVIQGASETVPVQLRFGGAERIDFGRPGELIVIRHGSREHYRPEAYQILDGKWRPLAVSYALKGGDRVNLTFGHFDNSAPVFLRYGAVTA